MKYLKRFNENFKGSNLFNPEILSTVNDILLELSDDGFEIKTKYWIGGRASYNKVAENIEIYISKNRKYEIDEIIEVYNRLCEYLESEGFKKDLLAENGKRGSIPHLTTYEFMGCSSLFSFSALTVDYDEYKKYKEPNKILVFIPE